MLFAAVARMAERQLSKFSTQGLANMAWAFATARHSDEKLFVVLAMMAQRWLIEFNA